AHELRIVHLLDVLQAEMAGRHLLENPGPVEFLQNGRDANRRLDVAAVADMVDVVPVVHDERNLSALWPQVCSARRFPNVAWLPQAYGIVTEGFHHLVDVAGRSDRAVLPFEDSAHDFPGLGLPKRHLV